MYLNPPTNPRDRQVKGRVGRKQPARQQTRGWLFYRGHGKKVPMEEYGIDYSPGKRFYVKGIITPNGSFYTVSYGTASGVSRNNSGNKIMYNPKTSDAFWKTKQGAINFVKREFSVTPVVLPEQYID